MLTKYTFVQTETSGLGSPYDNCITAAPTSQPGSSYYDGEFTLEGCYRSCMQDKIFATCNCYDDTLAYPESGEEKRCSALTSVPAQGAASECARTHTHTHCTQLCAYWACATVWM